MSSKPVPKQYKYGRVMLSCHEAIIFSSPPLSFFMQKNKNRHAQKIHAKIIPANFLPALKDAWLSQTVQIGNIRRDFLYIHTRKVVTSLDC